MFLSTIVITTESTHGLIILMHTSTLTPLPPMHIIPSFFIPALKHFFSRQYRHWFLLSLSTTQLRLNRHVYWWFFRTLRRKKPLHPSQLAAPQCFPVARSPHMEHTVEWVSSVSERGEKEESGIDWLRQRIFCIYRNLLRCIQWRSHHILTIIKEGYHFIYIWYLFFLVIFLSQLGTFLSVYNIISVIQMVILK